MSEPVIKVENLSKLYHLGEIHKQTNSFRDKVTGLFKRNGRHKKDETIWALKDVSFEVKQGEVVGIIGYNGAGKSTLLKVLSRITSPTRGKAWINGRVSSLLEVGTGFHPELTGRENTYLNGAILGMKKKEIDRKFDEIIAFAEIEKFVDTPVKRYSSGMYVRLAFAVAAHLEPDILLVDEVLAVGDANFQKKCMNKMEKVGQEGRTILFVSHNMPAITGLCQRTILMKKGSVFKDGPSHHVVVDYLQSGLGMSAVRKWPNLAEAPGNDIARLRSVRVKTEDGQTAETLDIQHSVGIEMEYDVLKSGHVLVPNFHFHSGEGINIFNSCEYTSDWKERPRLKGRYKSTVWIPGNFLTDGTIIVGAAISTMSPVVIHFYEHEVVAFQVLDNMNNNPTRAGYEGTISGVMLRPLLKWDTHFNSG